MGNPVNPQLDRFRFVGGFLGREEHNDSQGGQKQDDHQR
jgi:hypothetical protein